MLKLCEVTTSDKVKLYGTLHKAKSMTKPLIVIAHGYFSSNRIGPHRLYYQIAERLSNNGFNVIRFDLRGIGESEKSIEGVTFEDHISDLNRVISTFYQRFNDPKIIIIGHCIGSNIALQLLCRNPNQYEKVILISPYFTTEATLNSFFSPQQLIELKQNGYTFRKGVYANASYFSGANKYENVVKDTCELKEKIAIISAKEDQYIPFAETLKLYSDTGLTQYIIEKADHNYLDLNARSMLLDTVERILGEGDNYD